MVFFIFSSAEELERRFIDGKWICEDGCGGYLVFVDGTWIRGDDEDLRKKWNDSNAISSKQTATNRCIVDGITMEWNSYVQKWLPVVEVDEDFLAKYHTKYGLNYDYGSLTSAGPSTESSKEIKTGGKTAKNKISDKKIEQGWVELDESKNTSVYITNLPRTIDLDSLHELMSKCGVIQRDARINKPKLKIYKFEDGTPKGDATCVYIKKESVDLALQILDGWKMGDNIIRVERAKYEMKGEFDPKKKKKKLTSAQKKRFLENQQKIFEWRPEKPRNYRPFSDCTVVMKNMFTIEQMMKNATLLFDLEDETRKVCERFGPVKKVVVHDSNPEGVICVTFTNVEHSDAAVSSLNGRVIDGRKIEVNLWDGKTKYAVAETEEQKAERIAHWRQFISDENC
ncbi:unnamed protein product [Dracunculus medinensis]|uniref:HIV Tat-specific factor 1 n=1 Tax=Dracunculus medinensis TaxID=318479 RepID=A0A158Q3F0_DRAME|nr:unnamed protein product [Dracunculus medinensis]